ncbi:VgrG protein [Acidisarcina polymorpha]|uniref:VgrG protein n=1 Tax=Acidisarcina polymorpha TaxID=2211140 RepID=A0A2Z5G3J4_9BACT|nr:type VI secretion system tip protein TssI/VgrG [Acidisarcina polymorpha]AXC13374.1 VgrG protein [Acidisarcina polymorpha]
MAGYTQTNRILLFNSPLGANTLLAIGFRGVEAISELFDFEVDVLSEPETVIDPSALVGKRVTLELQVTDTGTKRYFNGIVASLEGTGGDTFFNRYRVRVVPMLWLLSLSRQTRVFQDMTVLEIAEKVLSPYSIVPQLDTQASYSILEYCTQYRETDLEFIERILQQQGIFFYFIHSAADHVLVLSDTSALCSECPVASHFDFAVEDERQLSFYKPLILDFRSRSALIAGDHTSWDYRFMQYAVSHASPQTARSTTQMGENSHERYDYADSASAFFKTEGAEPKTPIMQTQLQNVERDVEDAQSIDCHGQSTASTMQSGFTFTLSKYPQSEKNIKYLLTRVTHFAQQQPGYRSEVVKPDENPYMNSFEARPFTQVYRKEKTIAKPRVQGVVTGKVVTFPGEDSYLDRFGRVCVQFWWDRQRPPETPDKTLLRVAQQWAGKGWGTYFWPRIGDEVLIDFLDGDPDAPIVVGSVYNGVNMPKYDPKSEYTRSGILTRSSKGGGAANANELRFDDLKGSEQIFMNAERNFDLHVEHDWHRLIGNEEHSHILKHQYQQVDGRAHLRVGEEQVLEIEGGRYLNVKGEQASTVAGNYSLKVAGSQISRTGVAHVIESGEEIHIKGGVRVIIEGGLGGICLQSAESAISIDATGIAIQGAVRFGKADCLPALPDPIAPASKSVISPNWPGDDPRA